MVPDDNEAGGLASNFQPNASYSVPLYPTIADLSWKPLSEPHAAGQSTCSQSVDAFVPVGPFEVESMLQYPLTLCLDAHGSRTVQRPFSVTNRGLMHCCQSRSLLRGSENGECVVPGCPF